MTMLCGISLLISFETTNFCHQLIEDHQDDKMCKITKNTFKKYDFL